MDLTPRRTSVAGADRRWILDRHGLDSTTAVVLDSDLFTGDVVKSGTVIGVVTTTNLAGPYDNAATDGRQVAVGFLVNDEVRKAGGRPITAVFNHGAVDANFLPVANGPGALDAAARADLTHVRFRG